MNERDSKRALVTGGTGYVGAMLVRRLVADGWDVHLIVRPDSDAGVLGPAQDKVVFHPHDGSTEGMIGIVRAAAPDVVFHLASLFLAQHTVANLEQLVRSNILFSTQLVEAMASNGVRHLVNTGTSWQHYENDDYNPVNLYAATKQAFESLLAYYIEAHGLVVTTLVLFDTYGPDDWRSKLIALLWKTSAATEPLAMSPGEQMIDLVHIDDVIEAFLLAAAQLRMREHGHERYGISSGQPLRLRDLVLAFERATGTRVPITWGGRPYRPREVMTTWTRFAPVPGWQPRIPFETGILQTRPATAPGA
ncbi:NAD-dependent epimerase/dehydratase family protein [Massilia phyllosphaerae]|uniref:NAD-dependent epimerase/dehydratase family protein n=1 Tax=Massilia phyllosphaerae TaxID=3106034 RepID=UPI002B1CBF1A|nr:NAD(P)-dependent oxidoreductase [Massilia sp. SGZ-792]